jgi:hypothetical protein
MPYSFELKDGVIVSAFVGDFTIDEFHAAKQELVRQPWFRPEMPHIIDFTAATYSSLRTWQVSGLANEESVVAPSATQVIVVRDMQGIGLAKMFQVSGDASGRRTVIVGSIEAAWKAVHHSAE